MVQIKHRFTGDVICEGVTITAAATANIKLLRGANLRGADLGGADLRGADLGDACLRDAYLRGANLRGANLRGADLGGAYLRGANLRGADLGGADLRGADLRGAKLAWQSHDLLAEILRRAAGDDTAKLKVAGLILISREKCWRDFFDMAEREPLAGWALDELAKWVQPDDGAPTAIVERAKAQQADQPPQTDH